MHYECVKWKDRSRRLTKNTLLFVGRAWRIELMFSNTGFRKTDLMGKLGKQRLGEEKGSRCQEESLSVNKLVRSRHVGGLSHLIIGIAEIDKII